jgi:hypothetical protein
MAVAYKILGQIQPSANVLTNVYSVPVGSNTIINTIAICNFGNSNAIVDFAVRPDTEALANKHYIIKTLTIPPADSFLYSPGITLAAKSVVVANNVSTNNFIGTNVAFSVFGVEIS